ncbi:Ubiquitin [Oopsacas minuta]|uniref:Ubiquitin n=1 Tax=Oopsacas minuta TaxID=111878 RepID=A0AAV7JEW0_9METZ|nr:Ubiquitin [Oopsacas minuta]
MATNSIFVVGVQGKTHSINIPIEDFKEYTVSQLKRVVYKKTGIEPENQRLLYGSKQLEDVRNGCTMKIQDYGLSNNCTVALVVRLLGGINC